MGAREARAGGKGIQLERCQMKRGRTVFRCEFEMSGNIKHGFMVGQLRVKESHTQEKTKGAKLLVLQQGQARVFIWQEIDVTTQVC